jgi:3-oxoacyl-[acyl-carrier protein] reductase
VKGAASSALSILGIEGKTALVSGSTRGIGLAIAAALAGAGAKVALNYLKDDLRAGSALDGLKAKGALAVAVKADVSDGREAERLVREVVSALGPVDILVNNAHGRIVRTPFAEATWAEHQAHLDGILKAAFNLTRAVLGGMRERGWGRVVNIGNNMVLQPVTGYSAYTSAMASLLGFTRNLAGEAGGFGVTVNMVSPGFVLTEEAPNTTEAVRLAIAGATPLKRLAVPEDVAGAVLFFCSELGRFVTGENISVDGGRVMG